MKTVSPPSLWALILKKSLFIYLPLAGCIFLSNYWLPDDLTPTVSSRFAPLNYEYYELCGPFTVGPILPRLLRVENNNHDKPYIKKPEGPTKAQVALIIDDVGYNPSILREIAKIPIPLSWAVLPYSPFAKECLREAETHGFEIILHLPLEPLDHTRNPGPGVIRRNWNETEIERQLTKNLEAVPGAIGVNNHMGSLGTQDPHLMACLMKIIGEKGLFFIDSRTTAASVAEQYALEYQVPYARRHVFIDNDNDPISKKAALRQLIKIALQEGSAIGIAHVKEGNAAVIAATLPEFKKAGVEFVPISEVMK